MTSKNRNELFDTMEENEKMCTVMKNHLEKRAIKLSEEIKERQEIYSCVLNALNVSSAFCVDAAQEEPGNVAFAEVLDTMKSVVENDWSDNDVLKPLLESASDMLRDMQSTRDKMLRSMNQARELVQTCNQTAVPIFLSANNLLNEHPSIPADMIQTVNPFVDDVAALISVENGLPAVVPAKRTPEKSQWNMPRPFPKSDYITLKQCQAAMKNNEHKAECLHRLPFLYNQCVERVKFKDDICQKLVADLNSNVVELQNINEQCVTWMKKRQPYSHRIIPKNAFSLNKGHEKNN